jgi:pyruvate dehydrogenase E2 component (dihydrolipoamide acetyltransferase)
VPAPAPATRAPAPAPKKRAVSPRARKFAADFLIDLDRVSGTGPGDRVVERDVQAYLETSGYLARKITPAALNLARQEKLLLLDLEATGPSGRVTVDDVKRAVAEKPRPMSKMRRIIAQRLQQSKQTIPHFYVTVSVDMTDLAVYRKVLKEQGFALSFNDFVLNAVAESLVDMPSVNSTTDGNTVRWNSRVNVGMAVSIDTGLVVPVLRETDRMSLDEIHDVARELAGKARDGKLLPEEMQGSTFTVSNMGMLNIDEFSAIINPGESAILAVSSIVPSAVVTDDRQIVVRDMMKITLSADHRIVDGADAAAFVNAVKRRLQDMDRWQKQTGVPMPRA